MADTDSKDKSTLSLSNEKPVHSPIIWRGDECVDNLQKKINWSSISDYVLFNENGMEHHFKEVFSSYKTIVIFIRHFLCFVTKEYVEDLAKIPKALLEEKKIRLAIVGCGGVKYMKQFRKDTGYWAEFYTDPTGELYSLMGCKLSPDIGNLSNSKHTKSSTMAGIFKSAWRAATFPGEWQGNLNQQGGVFILGPGEHCSFAHRDENASDHYRINRLLDMVGVDNISFQKDSAILNI